MAENNEEKVTNKGKLIDKNRLFFGLIHYILSEQNNVNWIIRSSLIDITGVSNVLEEKPYKKDSILQDVVDYITEMKPYHVQFSHYFEHYQTASETVKIPGNDWIEPTYNLQFDALQSYPDINKIFHSVVDTLPSEEDAREKKYNINVYNDEGLIIFNTNDNHFYVRHYNDDAEWEWIQSDEKLSYDGYYAVYYPTKLLYKVAYDIDKTSDTLKVFSEKDMDSFINSHKANRLFYIKYWDKDKLKWTEGGITNFEEIKKELNANFKGIEINGSVFDIEKFGYDIFNYETTDYDSPTVVYDYYFIDDKEHLFEEKEENPLFDYEQNFSYKKVFVSTTEHRFSLDPEFANNMQAGDSAIVYKCSVSGNITEYFDYELLEPYNYFDIFNALHDREKAYIVVYRQTDSTADDEKIKIKYAYVMEGTSFIESSSDVLRREMVVFDPNGNELKIPSAEIASEEKIAIQKKTQSGSYNPFTNYVYNDGKITIISGVHVYDHIVMTAFDYKYLYDKIYTWEDRYGRSNNLVNLDGMGFLRARYEDDRPAEKVVSYPLNTLFIKKHEYKEENNDSVLMPTYSIFMNDFKNSQSSTVLYNNAGAVLCKEPEVDSNGMITSLYISSINNFESPIGKALINSEILEYKKVNEIIDSETNEKYWELTNFNRGMYGSTLFSELLPKYPPYKMTHTLGDRIIPYIEDEWYSKERNNVYKSYNIIGNGIKQYTCPTGYKFDSSVEITKLPKVNLLEDVTGNSTEIIIDSPNVVSGWIKLKSENDPESLQTTLRNESSSTVYTSQNGTFSLKINDDTVYFKSIYKDPLTSNYHLTDITLPIKYQNYGDNVIYSAADSFIYSCVPETLNNYNISYIEGDYKYDIVQDDDKTYVQMFSVDPTYSIIDDVVVENPTGTNMFRIENNNVFIVNTTFTNEDIIETTENYFGYISNGFVYKTNGDIYAKIEDIERTVEIEVGDEVVQRTINMQQFITIQIVVTIDDELKKGESIHINVLN